MNFAIQQSQYSDEDRLRVLLSLPPERLAGTLLFSLKELYKGDLKQVDNFIVNIYTAEAKKRN